MSRFCDCDEKRGCRRCEPTYIEQFADAKPAFAVSGIQDSPEQLAELKRQRDAENARYQAARQQQRERTRDRWSFRVADLKAAIADLPDDMPVTVDGELGPLTPEPAVTEENYDIDGPVLELGGGW